MKYNFVFYGATNTFLKNTFQEADSLDNATVRGDFLDSQNKLLQMLFKAHTYPQFNHFFQLPGKGIWLHKCFNFEFKYDNPICFIFEAKYFNQDFFFDYLKQKFPNCKLVITFRDLYLSKKRIFKDLDISNLRRKFDLIMSYDKNDCKKFNMVYFNLEASRNMNIHLAKDYPWYDVIFIGRVKGRLDKIIRSYDILNGANLKCYFYVVGETNIRKHGDIIFSSKIMPYEQMLEKTINSRCVLELSQAGEYGFTSRSQEAIMYNKKLITDSSIVKEQRFYPSKDIMFITDVEEIDPNFVKDKSTVDYGYNGEYSPVRLLELIEKSLG